MKNNRFSYLILLLLTTVLFTCQEENTFRDVAVSAPTDLSVKVAIADDESGELTVFPQASSAAYFDVDFGDGGELERIQPGKSGMHTYTEGTYSIRVIAYNLKGQSAELTESVSIMFTPPANLMVDVQIDPVETNLITVTPTADNATFFEVYFGDVMDEEATTVLSGATTSHTYVNSGQYTLKVVARSASSQSLEYTEVLDIVKPAKQLTLPIDFEDAEITYTLNGFGGATLEVIDNPDASGVNTSAKVARLNKMADSETWAGGFLQLPTAIDFSDADQFTVKVWSPKSGVPVLFKLENESDPNLFFESQVMTTTNNAWEELTFDVSTINQANSYHKIVIFMDFGTKGDDSDYYFDEIILGKSGGSGGGGGELSLPLDFESATLNYTFTGFGNVSAAVIDNPDASGINTSAKVVELMKPSGAETWGGAFIQLPDAIDLSNMRMAMKVWSPKSGITVLLKLENAGNGDLFHEVKVTNTTENSWEEMEFDLSGIDQANTYEKIVLFFDFDVNGDGSTYYFDDILLK